MSIINVDLNLLTAFKLLMETRKVTDAAQKAGVTQSAMSHMLSRLRKQLDDPLFIKTTNGMIPTDKAEVLYQKIQTPLLTLFDAVNPQLVFEPANSDRTFVFMLPDYVAIAFFSQLLAKLNQVAPNIKVHCIQATDDEFTQSSSRIDFAFGHYSKLPDNYYRKKLWKESFVTIASASHPRIKKRLSLKQFTQEKHILVSPNARGESLVDRLLRDKQLNRNISVKTPNFTSPPRLVENSELLCTLPKSVAFEAKDRYRVNLYPPPIMVPEFDVSMAWGPVVHHEPAHQWMRQLILSLV